jgi:membrane-associated protein
MDQNLIETGGAALIAALVFIETGFLLGLIVPGGETLLLAAGLMSGSQSLHTPLAVLIVILIGAAFAGDLTGYWLGKKLGGRLHRMQDGFIYKRKYLEQSEAFYRKHKKRSLILGRFLPVIRTFNPLLSGSGNMGIAPFALYSGIGCVLYISSLVLAGYFLGSTFPQLQQYIKYVFLGVAAAVIITLAYKWWQDRKKEPRQGTSNA